MKSNDAKSTNGKPAGDREQARTEWTLRPPFKSKHIGFLALAILLLGWSGMHVQMDRLLGKTAQSLGYLVGVADESAVAEGFGRVFDQMLPPTVSQETPVERTPNFDPEALPPFSKLKVEEYFDVDIDYETLEQDITVVREETLVEPLGYLFFVILKMGETLEIGLWGTLLAIVVSAPLAYFSAKNYSPNLAVYGVARSLVSFLRSVPELVSALFFVLAYGFGPIAGILALGFHCAGFLGKFYAEDMENADRAPQEALLALGASKLKVFRLAVLPQVVPQYIAYTLYILDRNVRMATVVGIVGAGGIGQELIGRWDIFDYSHVTTILIVLFVTVLLLDQLSARIRARIIG